MGQPGGTEQLVIPPDIIIAPQTPSRSLRSLVIDTHQTSRLQTARRVRDPWMIVESVTDGACRTTTPTITPPSYPKVKQAAASEQA